MENLIYLDNAATAWPKPPHVYDFMTEFYRNSGVNPGRSGFDMAISAGDLVEKTRERLMKFFNGDLPERTIFTYNATDGLNLIINGIVGAGDHVITTMLEHNSVIRPLNHLKRDHNVEVTYLPFDEGGFVDPQDVAGAFQPNTKLVIVNHGSNVIGSIQDVEAIGKVVKEKGALFAIDASQTAGVIPIDMKKMHIDILATTGHKALMGPTGIGVVIVRDGIDINITRAGGTGVRSAYPYHLDEYPYRLEAGTLNLMGIAGLWAGQDWIDETGILNIRAHEMKLAQKLVDGARSIQGVTLYGVDSLENHLSTISVNVDGVEALNSGIMLDVDHSIAVRTGLQCAPLVHEHIGTTELHGTVRFSIGAFNTEAHIDAALKGLEAVQSVAAKIR
ncbi:aminotransferase class V-fold PLP-dependent enzyme [bacterium]|nr:aminotransferase class V-fold PLP-dependent enzyme [bacterium]